MLILTLDGITNSVDQCPNVKETYNMFKDTDGCPDFIGSDKVSSLIY